MKLVTTIASAAMLVALTATPAFAVAPPVPPQAQQSPGGTHIPQDNPGTPNRPVSPGASLPDKAKAYGRYCKAQSKKHVDGEKGTPFSRCVTAMAKLASEDTNSPRNACKTLSKKYVDGEKGTPFSRCVSAGAKLLKDQETPTA